MSRFSTFAVASLLATAATLALGLWAWRVPTAAFIALFFLGQVAASYCTAGRDDRTQRLTDVVTRGVLASVITAVVIVFTGAPIFLGGLFALDDGDALIAYALMALAVLITSPLLFFALRLAHPRSAREPQQ